MIADVLSLPPVIGHRGARAFAPENTLPGLRVAKDQGATWVEVDVKLTRDGVPVLIHDETLQRTTNGRGAVRETDFADLRRLEARAGFGAAFAGVRIPTLEEALELALDLGLGVNLELKPCPGREAETARLALARARAAWPADRPPPLVSSFAVACLEVALTAAPSWPRGYLIDRRPADWCAIADRIEAATIHVNWARENPTSLAAYISTGRPLLAYTVNDGARARALLGAGVAAVFTDRPAAILAALAR